MFYYYNKREVVKEFPFQFSMSREVFGKLKLIFIPCQDNKYRPKFLGSKFLFYYALLLLLLKLLIVPFFLYFPKTVFFADLTKANLIELTNTARKYFGLQPLKESPLLNEAAYLKAKDMIEKGYFSHYSPQGIAPWYWLKISGYNYQLAGENLAIGFLDPEQVYQAWMDSPSHKKNILNPDYQEIGIAVLKDNFQGNETTLVVQFFGSQKAAIPQEKIVQPPKERTEEMPGIPIKEEKKEIVEEKEQREQNKQEEQEEKEALNKVAAIESKEMISAAPLEKFKKTPSFLLFQFMTSNYYDLIQKIIYGSLIFIIISLFLTIFCDLFIYRQFQIQYKDIIFKAIGFAALWFVLLFLDKLIIIQLIANNFRIN
jgi:hypothetical protein